MILNDIIELWISCIKKLFCDITKTLYKMSMYYYEFLGIITFIIISAVFFVAGYNMRLFSALFIAVLCSYIVSLLIINSKKDLSGDMFLTLTGFILYFFGLLIVQAVIKRSVSLHLVIRPSKESIVKRIK